MEGSLNEVFEDGFESDDEDKVDIMRCQEEKQAESRIALSQPMIKYIPPPQEIKEKSYSLHPDIMTGWAPKISLPKPVPLTFPHDPLEQALKNYFRNKPAKPLLVYLGPRFDSTYSAWNVLGVDFPYHHLINQRVSRTDRRFEGMNPELSRYDGLHFEGMFESGNLDAAFKVGANEYDCFMRVDSNTRGHLQWYYFKITNLRKDCVYQLNICNFQKAKTLYNRGMKPYILSHRDLKEKGEGWRQGGNDILYAKSSSKTYRRLLEDDEDDEQHRQYFTLSFKLCPCYEDDTIQVAYCPPYTFSKLSEFVKNVVSVQKQRNIIACENFCTSLGGFQIPILTITNSVSEVEAEFKNGKPSKGKGLIFVMGRIHPGQANGSHMMQGFIEQLCNNSEQSTELRSNFVFKVVPMINPDGVVMGNYRTGLSGRDFNRQFKDPDKTWFVEVNKLKAFLQRCKWIYQAKFEFFLDFHGHTVKKNAFTYGPEFPLTSNKYYESRLLPKLLSKRTHLFRYYSCIFKVTPSKATTARAILLREFRIPFVYTIEASNGSYYDYLAKTDMPFSVGGWQQLGKQICGSLYDYWLIEKSIQEARLRRRQQKNQIKFKTKITLSRKTHSSSMRRHTISPSGRHSKTNLQIDPRQQYQRGGVLNEIISELADDKQKEEVKMSDDDLSEGRSDSENSEDDLDADQIDQILKGKTPKPKLRIKHSASYQEQKDSEKDTALAKRQSFITQCEDDELEAPRKHPVFQRSKKHPFIRKKMYTTSGTPSPPKEPEQGKATKIVNLSFMLNPIPVSNSLGEKKTRVKTETLEDDYDGRVALRTDYSQNSRRNYLSVQRQSLRKQLMKRINAESNPMMMTSQPFRFQEVVGKRIFSEV